jgi:hypothetical protein
VNAARAQSAASGGAGAVAPTRTPATRRRFQTLASVLGNQAMQGLAQRGQLQILGPSGTVAFDLAALGEGVPPDLEDRRAVERRTGVDLSQVRVHDNREARRIVDAVDSELVTFGLDILRAGMATAAQMRHELAHIAQHGARPVDPSRPIVLGPRHAPEEHDAWSVAMGGEPHAVGDPNVARRDEEFDPSLEPFEEAHDPAVYATELGGALRFPQPDLTDPDTQAQLREWALGELGEAAEPAGPQVDVPVAEPTLDLPVAEPSGVTRCASCHTAIDVPTVDAPVAEPSGGTQCAACHATALEPPQPSIDPDLLAALRDFEPSSDQQPTQDDPCPSCHDIINRPVYRRVPPEPSTHEIWQQSMQAGSAEAITNEGQTVQETADLVEMQVIAARSRALGAAQAAGAAPPDLQVSWQQALMAVENLKVAAPELAQPADPAVVAQAGTEPAAELDLELQETARDAIGAFYWGMIDALERLEAEQAQLQRVDDRREALDIAQDPPGYRCQVNCHAPNGPTRSYYEAPRPHSPGVIERSGRVETASDLAAWRTVIADFEQTHSVDIEFLISETLPRDSAEVTQLELAHRLQERLTTLREEHPTMVRVPAVFYPEDDLQFEQQADGTSQQEAQGYSWYLFVYRDGDQIVLKDITSDTIYTNTQGVPDERTCPVFDTPEAWAKHDFPDAAMSDLFDQLNTAIRFPVGRLYYRWPGKRDDHLDTTEPWEMSDWLRAIGIAIAAIGLVLMTAGYGTPAAIALVGASLVSAAATYRAQEEQELQGLEGNRARMYFDIGVDLLSALTFGVGRIASATTTLGRIAIFAGRVYAPLVRLNAAANLAQVAVMTSDFATAFEQLGGMPDGPEKRGAMARLIMIGLASGALAISSLRGDVDDLIRGARPHLNVDVDGRLIRPDVDLPAGTTRTTIDDAPAPGSSTWRRPEVRTGEPDPTLGDRSIVINIRRRSDGLVTDVEVVPGRLADPEDIALHHQVAEMVANYGGLQGRIRLAWREIQGLFGRRRPPIEVELEIWKLEEAVRRRVSILESVGTSRRVRRRAQRELDVIEANLARTRRQAERAAARPVQPGETAQIWMSTAPPGHTQPPSGYGWYLTHGPGPDAIGRWQLMRDGTPVLDARVRLRAEHDDAGNFLAVSNREQVTRARVIGRRVEEVGDRLNAMGYRVDGNRITRPRGEGVLGLRVDRHTGIIRESVSETTEVAQERIAGTLNRAQRRELESVRRMATADQEVVLLEGVYDLGATWTQLINHHGGRQTFITRLTTLGVPVSDATHLVDTLLARQRPLLAVHGTSALRSFDYAGDFARRGGVVPSGGHAHHGDPLYLGGTHELIAGLPAATHGRVHGFFNNLTLPPGSRHPGQRLAPGSLAAVIPRGAWRRGVATIHHGGPTPGAIDYAALGPSTHPSATSRSR